MEKPRARPLPSETLATPGRIIIFGGERPACHIEHMKRMREQGHLALVAATVVALAACTAEAEDVESAPSPSPTQSAEVENAGVSGPCLSAMAAVSEALEAHYAKSWGDDWDAEELAWQATMVPIFEACESRDDLLLGGKVHPYVFGMTGSSYIDRALIDFYCDAEAPESPACSSE